jgi:hypothetical protein
LPALSKRKMSVRGREPTQYVLFGTDTKRNHWIAKTHGPTDRISSMTYINRKVPVRRHIKYLRTRSISLQFRPSLLALPSQDDVFVYGTMDSGMFILAKVDFPSTLLLILFSLRAHLNCSFKIYCFMSITQHATCPSWLT